MKNSNYKVLVVDDDHEFVEAVKELLERNSYTVITAYSGKEAIAKANEVQGLNLALLDLVMPMMDGFEVCKRIRAEDRSLPILMLTSKAEELDKVLGLELGADDYMTKPFSVRELLARVKAIFRRIEVDKKEKQAIENRLLEYGDLVVNLEKRKVLLREQSLELTAKEFDLLVLFAENPGRAYSRQELLDLVWGYQYSGYSHTVNSHINRLRNKLEPDINNPKFILTTWGIGYRFNDEI